MPINTKKSAFAALAGITAAAAAYLIYKQVNKDKRPTPATVPHVDLQRYLGDWYDLAHYPARFQKGYVGAMAHYSLNEDGSIRVINTARKHTLDGPVKKATGKAWVVDESTNAKLKVQFFWPFSGDYWVIGLDDDYQWAIVGHPQREYLWILSRAPHMDNSLKAKLLDLIRSKGYDLAPIQWIAQQEQRWTEEELTA